MKFISIHPAALAYDITSITLHRNLKRIMETSIALTGSHAAAIIFYSHQDSCFTAAFTEGLSNHFINNMRFTPSGFAEQTLIKNMPLVCGDAQDSEHPLSGLAKQEEIRSYVCMPLTSEDTRLGVFCIYQKDADQFTPLTLNLLATFSKLAANSIDSEREIQLRKEAEKRADLASKAKSEFLANMSHEIRTPMNAVLGMLSLLKETTLTVEQQEFVNIAHSGANALLTILNDILDISKIEAGKLVLEEIEFNLRDAIEDVIDLMVSRAQEKDLELSAILSSNVPERVIGDPTRIRQLLTNLIGNAIKFTAEGEVLVSASVVQDHPDESVIGFYIKDTGIGLSEKAKANIFKPFAQADSSTTRKFGGTGLGLSICKQLAQIMGGEIGLDSEEGKGSTFWFHAKFTKVAGHQDNPYATGKFSEFPVLLLENSPTSTRVLANMFEEWKMPLRVAQSSASLLDELDCALDNGCPFKILLLEITRHQDRAYCLSLAEQIKAAGRFDDTRLILLTSFGQRGDAKAAMQLGISAYLTRPIRKRQLESCISLLMGIDRKDDAQLITRHDLRGDEQGTSIHILLVEDNLFNQKVAVNMLKKLGHRVEVANNGLEALAALEQKSYDLILMDSQMPEMDGITATQQIRAKERREQSSQTTIIAMTAEALEGDEAKFRAAGMNDYLSKPVQIEQMRTLLSRWVSVQPALAKNPGDDAQPVNAPTGLILNKADAGSPESNHEKLPVVRKETFEHLRSEMGPHFDQAIGIFFRDVPIRIQEISESLPTSDMKSLHMNAHTIKGGARYLGLDRLEAVCHRLEMLTQNQLARQGNNLFVELQAQFELANLEVTKLLGATTADEDSGQLTR